ncbi:hypothetical protein GBAR_LOCUS21734 [Geodia barretti]|uniref:Uncharacterized protein n=1 Tax=Geodia barretti TaxID=519541 RepID=A0AA35T0V6_GEOBA|nr:hypothetical protein GBAR_LOCUS21734 [Geodia barretti]
MATTVTVPVPFEVKDPARKFTPLGRPFRKPRKVAASLSSLSSSCNLDELYFLEKPLLKPKIRVGPSPCSYTLPPPPRCGKGGKINPRTKYDRDLLPKPNYELWTLNTRTLEKAPSPCSYAVTNSIGGKSLSKKASPAYSIRSRPPPPRKTKAEVLIPAPNLYNAAKSTDYVSRHFPSFTIRTSNTRKKIGNS